MEYPQVGEVILALHIESGRSYEGKVVNDRGAIILFVPFVEGTYRFYKRKRPKNIDMILNAEYMKDKTTKKVTIDA